MLNELERERQREAELLIQEYDLENIGDFGADAQRKTELPHNAYRILERISRMKLIPDEDSLTLAGVAISGRTDISHSAGGIFPGTRQYSDGEIDPILMNTARDYVHRIYKTERGIRFDGGPGYDNVEDFAKKSLSPLAKGKERNKR